MARIRTLFVMIYDLDYISRPIEEIREIKQNVKISWTNDYNLECFIYKTIKTRYVFFTFRIIVLLRPVFAVKKCFIFFFSSSGHTLKLFFSRHWNLGPAVTIISTIACDVLSFGPV
jgi:hypothetical protein